MKNPAGKNGRSKANSGDGNTSADAALHQQQARNRKRKNISAQEAALMDKELERMTLLAVESIKREMYGTPAQQQIQQPQQQHSHHQVLTGDQNGMYASQQQTQQIYDLNLNEPLTTMTDCEVRSALPDCGMVQQQHMASGHHQESQQQQDMDTDAPGNLSWLMSFKLDSLFPEEGLDLDGANNNLVTPVGYGQINKEQPQQQEMKDLGCNGEFCTDCGLPTATESNSVMMTPSNSSSPTSSASPGSSVSSSSAASSELQYATASVPTTFGAYSAQQQQQAAENVATPTRRVVFASTAAPDSRKPPYTYTELIAQALKENGEMTVSAIYKWIIERFPFFKTKDGRWKNSVRHNLSINPQFQKGSKSRHGHLWTLAYLDSVNEFPSMYPHAMSSSLTSTTPATTTSIPQPTSASISPSGGHGHSTQVDLASGGDQHQHQRLMTGHCVDDERNHWKKRKLGQLECQCNKRKGAEQQQNNLITTVVTQPDGSLTTTMTTMTTMTTTSASSMIPIDDDKENRVALMQQQQQHHHQQQQISHEQQQQQLQQLHPASQQQQHLSMAHHEQQQMSPDGKSMDAANKSFIILPSESHGRTHHQLQQSAENILLGEVDKSVEVQFLQPMQATSWHGVYPPHDFLHEVARQEEICDENCQHHHPQQQMHHQYHHQQHPHTLHHHHQEHHQQHDHYQHHAHHQDYYSSNISDRGSSSSDVDTPPPNSTSMHELTPVAPGTSSEASTSQVLAETLHIECEQVEMPLFGEELIFTNHPFQLLASS